MNDRQLRYILAIAEKRSISAAAESLYISQPSLSAMLASVESELGVQLFDRKTNPMLLTSAGECYVSAAQEILSTQRGLEEQLSEIKDSRQGKLSICCGHQFSAILFPLLLPDFINAYPKIQLQLFEMTHAEVENLRRSDDVDVIFSDSSVRKDFLDQELLLEEELVLFAPPGFTPDVFVEEPGHKLPCIDLSCTVDKPYVLMKKSSRMRARVDRIFEDYEFNPNIILETLSWETSLNMVKRGKVFTILPYSPLVDIPKAEMNIYSIKGNYKRRSNVYWRKHSFQPKVIDTFIRFTKHRINELIK